MAGKKNKGRTPVLTLYLKKAGKRGIWCKYNCDLGNDGDIWGKYCGMWGKYCGIQGKVLWYLVKHTKGGTRKGGIKSGVRTPILTQL